MRNASERLSARSEPNTPQDLNRLRRLAAIAGIGAALLFVAVGLGFRFYLFGDTSVFSYAVAVQDSWAFHWHNISNRSTVWLYALLPAELYAQLTGDARGAIQIYAFLFYGAQAAGLVLTYLLDRSAGRLLFVFACLSTAVLAPAIFGSPTEMWLAHALFWPVLASAHFTEPRWIMPASFVAFLALAFSHEGALLLIAAILVTVLARKHESRRFGLCLLAALCVLAVWFYVRANLPPDDYTGKVMASAAKSVFSVERLFDRMLLLPIFSLLGFFLLTLLLRAFNFSHAVVAALVTIVLALIAYWMFLNPDLHADDRYYLRTAVIVLTPAIGLLAICTAFSRQLTAPLSRIYALFCAVFGFLGARAVAAALLVLLFIHAVETARFAVAWNDHLVLFTQMVTRPDAGNSKFVEIDPARLEYRGLPWFSTLPYLSVLVAPDFKPARLAIDPKSDYFWISCTTATESLRTAGPRGIPAQSREMIRAYTCANRP